MASIKDKLKELYKQRSNGEESKGYNIAEVIAELTELEKNDDDEQGRT
jgi:hypothetical protein